MKLHKLLLLILFSVLVTACNSDDDDDEIAEAATESIQYFEWEGSINGEWVVDANGNKVRFEVENGYMNFGNTTYTNAWVDNGETANFSLDGEVIGAVTGVKDVNDNPIVALVALDGTYLDIVGTENDLHVDNTDIPAVLISSVASLSTETVIKSGSTRRLPSLSNRTEPAVNTPTSEISQNLPPPMPGSNAFTQVGGERKMGILMKKNGKF